jgi:hypothetical protein
MNGEKISGIFLLLLLAMPFAMGTKKTASNGNVIPSKLKARRGHFKPPAGATVIHIPDDEDGLIDKQQSGAGQEFYIGSSGLAAQPNAHAYDPDNYNYEMVEKWLNEPSIGSTHAEEAHAESPNYWSPKSDQNDTTSVSGQFRDFESYGPGPTTQFGLRESPSKTHDADSNFDHNNYDWLEEWLSNKSPSGGSTPGDSEKYIQNGSSGSAHLKNVESNGSEQMTKVGTSGSGQHAIHESPPSIETAQSSSQSHLMDNMLNHHQTSVPLQQVHGLASSPTSPEKQQLMDLDTRLHDYHDQLLEQQHQQWRQLEQQLQQQEQIQYEMQHQHQLQKTQPQPQLPPKNIQLEPMGAWGAHNNKRGGGKAAFHARQHKPPHAVPKISQHLHMPLTGFKLMPLN